MLGTLFAAMRECSPQHNFMASQSSDEILVGDHVRFRVMTSRVPAFGEDMMEPSHGFRLLNALHVGFRVPPAVIDPTQEVLACTPNTNHPSVAAMMDVWRPFGLRMENFFILMLCPVLVAPAPRSSISNESPFTHGLHHEPTTNNEGGPGASSSSSSSAAAAAAEMEMQG